MASRLAGKVAFISGGARGMGASFATLFAREGARVGFGDVLEEEGREVEAEIDRSGGQAAFVRLDVTSERDWEEAIAATVGRFGKLDVLVNNAGIGGFMTGIEQSTLEEWNRVMDINSKGVFLGTRAAIPEMRKAGGGSIVNISSVSGIIGRTNVYAGYTASKGAVRLLTKSAAVQYAKDGIRVNSIHPGPIVTPMTGGRMADPEQVRIFQSSVPMGRYGQPEEVAYGVLYLASDESSYVTGSELVIDGGATAR